MRTKRITLYPFNELSEEAKQRAINRLSDINFDHGNWWEGTYEDAEQAGIEIQTFDLETGVINGLVTYFEESIGLILENHGEGTETYSVAKRYRDQLDSDAFITDEHYDELEILYETAILKCYRNMLQQDYDFLHSDEAIIETIEANSYEFLKDGTLFNL